MPETVMVVVFKSVCHLAFAAEALALIVGLAYAVTSWVRSTGLKI